MFNPLALARSVMAATAIVTATASAEIVFTIDGDDVSVPADQRFEADADIGFEPEWMPVAAEIVTGDGLVGAVTAADGFALSLRLDEGAYRVTAELAGRPGGSRVYLGGEARRALAPPIKLAEGERATRTFTVWRMSSRTASGEIGLTPRERDDELRTYDDALTLTFAGERPALTRLTIDPAEDATSVFLAGDSTVTDQPGVPWSAWGAMLPRYFDDSVAVANLASSGRALRSFRAERRFEKLLELMEPGDYALIQFGHNDQKERGEGIGAFESYADDLRDYVDAIRAVGGRPVLLTSVVRRRFDDAGRWYDTLGDYPEAVRRVAAEKGVPLVDLHAMSRQIVEALGVEDSKRMYMHYPANAFPGQRETIVDDTHFNRYGGDLLARAVIEGLREAEPGLAARLRDGEVGIDLDDPERPADFHWPELPQAE